MDGLVPYRAWLRPPGGGQAVDYRVRGLNHPMDDHHAQFLIVVAEACLGAELGRLTVEVLTNDGVRHRGVPNAVDVDEPEIADRSTLRLDRSEVALGDVVELVVRPPA